MATADTTVKTNITYENFLSSRPFNITYGYEYHKGKKFVLVPGQGCHRSVMSYGRDARAFHTCVLHSPASGHTLTTPKEVINSIAEYMLSKDSPWAPLFTGEIYRHYDGEGRLVGGGWDVDHNTLSNPHANLAFALRFHGEHPGASHAIAELHHHGITHPVTLLWLGNQLGHTKNGFYIGGATGNHNFFDSARPPVVLKRMLNQEFLYPGINKVVEGREYSMANTLFGREAVWSIKDPLLKYLSKGKYTTPLAKFSGMFGRAKEVEDAKKAATAAGLNSHYSFASYKNDQVADAVKQFLTDEGLPWQDPRVLNASV